MLLLLLITLASSSSLAASPGWSVVHPQSSNQAGSSSQPSIRYGHSCDIYKGKLISTHGYYYDADRNTAAWLSDTWAMDVLREPHRWERLSDHLPQAEAFSHYSHGRIPAAPCGRYGHAAAVVGDSLLIYGGHDGGFSRTNRDDYRPENNDFEELWAFNLTSQSWTQLKRESGMLHPGRRYLAAATSMHGKFIMYGGLGAGRGGVWSYTPASTAGGTGRWELLSEEVPAERGGPGSRVGHSLLAWGSSVADGFVLYGGQTTLPNGTGIVNSDAWFFDLTARKWRRLQPVGSDGGSGGGGGSGVTVPPARAYYAAMSTLLELPPAPSCAAVGGRSRGPRGGGGAAAAAAASGGGGDPGTCGGQRVRVGVIACGTVALPGLQCARDAWALSLDCAATRIAWRRLPDLPASMYDTHGAALGGRAFIFGGHLCATHHPPRPPYPYYYVNEVLRLDLNEQTELLAWLRAGAGAAGEGGGAGGAVAAGARAVCVLAPGEAEEGGGASLAGGGRIGAFSDEL